MATETTSTYAELKQWLMTNIAAVLEVDPDTLDTQRNLDEYGLDSMQSVCLSGDLETWLGMEVPATAVWDYPTIDSLCQYLVELIARSTGAARQTASAYKLGADTSGAYSNPCFAAAASDFRTPSMVTAP